MRKILVLFRFYVLLAVLFSAVRVYAHNEDYGIHVKSYPQPADSLTSILLDGGEPIHFNGKDLTLKFDLWLRPENILGTVVRIITDTGKNVDLLYSIEDEERYPNLVTGDKANLQNVIPPQNEWVAVTLGVSPSSGKVFLRYNGVLTETDYPELKGAKSARIVFGLCRIEGYHLGDVASVNIKDISLMLGTRKIRSWQMKAHLGDRCIDEIKHRPAQVVNPEWIVDERAKWSKIMEGKFRTLPSIAFDPVVATFYIVAPETDKLFVYHSTEGVTDTIGTGGGRHFADYPNQLMYIPQRHTLLSYSIDDDCFAWFDASTHKWVNEGNTEKEHDFWNNSVSYNPADSSLVSFGGYGHYKFNNLLITSYPFSGKPQKSVMLSEIYPRRSSTTVIIGNELYIYGGRGCPSGRQELGSKNYYDLYRVNLLDNSVELLWNIDKSPFEGEFVGAENMIYDHESDSFLMLTTLDGGTLLKVRRGSGEMERMSYPMHLNINSHFFYGNLFYSSEQNQYYATIVTSQTDGETDLTIYKLPAPAVPVASLLQPLSEEPAEDGFNWSILIYIIGGLSVLTLGAAGWYRTKRRGLLPVADICSSEGPSDEMNGLSAHSSQSLNGQTAVSTAVEEESECTPKYYDLTRGCVRLFGSFQVFDKDGEDITASFTPTLKQLLLLLILYTGKNSQGISSTRLLEILWNDKEEEAAKNNRNVYMSRLRNLLKQIGDVVITSHNGFRNIKFGEGTMCDYLEAVALFKEHDPEKVDRLVELLFNGMMLPNVEFDYVDSFKSEFSNEAIDVLTKMLHDRDLSMKMKVKIADTIFQHDFVNEDALYVKCRTLHAQGRTGVARQVYTSFCKEYKSLMGSEYPRQFNEIINN